MLTRWYRYRGKGIIRRSRSFLTAFVMVKNARECTSATRGFVFSRGGEVHRELLSYRNLAVFIGLVLFLAPHSVFAVVAFDAQSHDAAAASGATGNFSWTHTPVGTPKAVIVYIVQGTLSSDQISSVTYGIKTLLRIASACDTVTEPGCVYAYAATTSIPTGAQTVTVTVSGSSGKHASAITLTAGNDTEVVAFDNSINANAANPTVTLSLGGRTAFVSEGAYGGGANTGTMTPFTNWTSRFEDDFGAFVDAFYTYDIIDSVDVSAGWTQSSDDAAMVATALSEIVTGSAPTVTTGYASNVGATTALLQGVISSDGGNSITTYGFATSTSATLSTGVSTSSFGSITAPATVATTSKGHSNNQTYYFRFYATNVVGTSYGDIHSFTTGNTGVARRMRIFQGYKIKFLNGKMYLQKI